MQFFQHKTAFATVDSASGRETRTSAHRGMELLFPAMFFFYCVHFLLRTHEEFSGENGLVKKKWLSAISLRGVVTMFSSGPSSSSGVRSAQCMRRASRHMGRSHTSYEHGPCGGCYSKCHSNHHHEDRSLFVPVSPPAAPGGQITSCVGTAPEREIASP